jgi:phage gp36-like protein
MTYATKSDMLLKFGETHMRQLTDIGTPRLNSINDDVLTKALSDATAWLNGFLAGRYALPITDPTALATLNGHCCNVARYMLMSVTADEQATALYKSADAYMTKVSTGAIVLIQPDQVPAQTGVGNVEFVAGDKLFARQAQSGLDWRGE